MIKNKIDYKLINISLIIFSVYLVYQTKDFWVGFLGLFIKVTLPFFISFIVAYAFYPFIKKLMNKGFPKFISVSIVVTIILLIIIAMLALIFPLLIDQTTSLFNGIISFMKEISLNYDLNFKDIQNTLSSSFNNILNSLGDYISNGAINVISVSLSFISNFFICLAAFIYFLFDMDKIRAVVKQFLLNRSKRMFEYVQMLDHEMELYLSGFMKIVIIAFFEYSIVYTIIGHPNAVLLGGLASFGNLIPYFGGIVTNIIAAITAFVISPELFIKTCIVFIIFSGIDGYVINPLVYGKTNKVHPLVVVMSVFVGGALFGIFGIIFSLPFSILLIATLKFFKDDIMELKEKRVKK